MIGIRKRGNDRAKQDIERQGYNNYNKMQNSKCTVVLYGCESWTIRKAERRTIDSFELWCWRRLLRIPWTAIRTNKSVIEEIKATNTLEALIKKQQLSYVGHIMRSENSLEKSMKLGMGGGARREADHEHAG